MASQPTGKRELPLRALTTGCLLLVTVAAQHVPAADSVVSNVAARQLPGSHLVEITYDLADDDGDSLHVAVEISADARATFAVTALTTRGDVGWLAPGRGKRVLWDAGVDLGEVVGDRYQAKVTANDEPPGMIRVAAGRLAMGSHSNFGYIAPLDGQPVHTVNLNAFWIDRHEVTNRSFARFVAATDYVTTAERKGVSWSYRSSLG